MAGWQSLALVGLFRLPALVAWAIAVAVAARRWAPRLSRWADESPPAWQPSSRLDWLLALPGTFAVTAAWCSLSASSVRNGPAWLPGFNVREGDSMTYHLPLVTNLVQSGSGLSMITIGRDVSSAVVPLGSELLIASLVLPFGVEAIVPLYVLAWLPMLFLAAVCLGGAIGRPAVGLAAMTVVTALPLTLFFVGSAKNDAMALFLVVAGIAVLAMGRGRAPVSVIHGLATGLLIGLKFPAWTLSAGLFAVAVAMSRHRRVRTAGRWLVACALTGWAWPVRNILVAGNPMPTMPLSMGPIELASWPDPLVGQLDRTALEAVRYDGVTTVLRYAAPGLGRAWVLVMCLAAAGLVAGVRRRGAARAVALAATGLFGIFMASPLSWSVVPVNPPMWIQPRFAFGALVLALTTLSVGRRALGALATATLGLTCLWTLAGASFHLPGTIRRDAVLTALVAGAGVGVAAAVRNRSAAVRVATLACSGLLALVTLQAVQQRYVSEWPWNNGTASGRLAAWTAQHAPRRLAVAGEGRTYLFFGPQLDRDVLILGDRRLRLYDECRPWLAALDRRDVSHVAIGRGDWYDRVGGLGGRAPFERWLLNQPNAHLVLHEGEAWIFRLDGRMDLARCPEGRLSGAEPTRGRLLVAA